MSDMLHRLNDVLEPILCLEDPRAKLSAYHNMPCAIFHYPAEEEFALRQQVSLLATRLSQRGKQIHRISLAECLEEAMVSERPLEDWFQIEREMGVETVVETIHSVLSDLDFCPLVELVAKRLPPSPDPRTDIVFINRTGALFPAYRTFSLLEQLTGRITCPAILFYPGIIDGASGLQFMGVLDAEHNYRPKIF